MLVRKSGKVLEAGIDEAGRGCLAGSVYVAAVVLPDSLPPDEEAKWRWIRDSKTLSAKRRSEMREYIQSRAVAWAVESADVEEIHAKNILGATMAAMNRVITKLAIQPEYILVDGNHFRCSADMKIPYECVEGGDGKYMNIAAASILAKTYHDDHVRELLRDHPEWGVYGWEKNMCYGTAKHREAIKTHGITPVHRVDFGICRSFSNCTKDSKTVLDFVDET